jgi:hypothetical protein
LVLFLGAMGAQVMIQKAQAVVLKMKVQAAIPSIH